MPCGPSRPRSTTTVPARALRSASASPSDWSLARGPVRMAFGAQLVEHLLLGEGELGGRDDGVLVVADRDEAHRRAAHFGDDDELRSADAEHLGDAVQQLARALAHLAGRVQDLGGAVEELVAVRAALALACRDLSGEDQDRRGHEHEREPRRRGQDHQRDDPEAGIGRRWR